MWWLTVAVISNWGFCLPCHLVELAFTELRAALHHFVSHPLGMEEFCRNMATNGGQKLVSYCTYVATHLYIISWSSSHCVYCVHYVLLLNTTQCSGLTSVSFTTYFVLYNVLFFVSCSRRGWWILRLFVYLPWKQNGNSLSCLFTSIERSNSMCCHKSVVVCGCDPLPCCCLCQFIWEFWPRTCRTCAAASASCYHCIPSPAV